MVITGNVQSNNLLSNGVISAAGAIIGDGGSLSNIQGANVSGNVASAVTAGTVTTNFGEENSLSFIIPFQYGYGESYIQSALKVLVKENIIPNRDFIRKNNVLVRANIYRNCKKSELKNITL